MVNPSDIAGNTEEEEDKHFAIDLDENWYAIITCPPV